MFAYDLPVAAVYARLSGRPRNAGLTVPTAEPQEAIRQALADMVPSTAEEIAEATGLDQVVVDATLDRMAARYRVMFNPLTKRFSLPKLWGADRRRLAA